MFSSNQENPSAFTAEFTTELARLVEIIARTCIAHPSINMWQKVGTEDLCVTVYQFPNHPAPISEKNVHLQLIRNVANAQVLQFDPRIVMRRATGKVLRFADAHLKHGHVSAYQSRDDWEHVDGNYGGGYLVKIKDIVLLACMSGLTEKLDEAILLTTLVEMKVMAPELAVKLSRPRVSGGHNKPVRNFDQFYAPMSGVWAEKREEALGLTAA